MWAMRKESDDELINKIYELLPRILQGIDCDKKEGKILASKLCNWAVFVDQIDDERKQLLLSVATYSDESYNSYELLKSISEISETQPFEAHEIWMKMLERSTPDYPEEAIRKIFTNLFHAGLEGERKVREAVSEYLKHGSDGPDLWLREIRKSK